MAVNPSPLLATPAPANLSPGIQNLQLAFEQGILSGAEIAEALTVGPSRIRRESAQNRAALRLQPLQEEAARIELERSIATAPRRQRLEDLQFEAALGQAENVIDVQSEVARMNSLKIQDQVNEFEGLLGAQPFASTENAVSFFERTRPGERVPQDRKELAAKNREAYLAIQQFKNEMSRFTGQPVTETFEEVDPKTFNKRRVRVTFDGAGNVVDREELGITELGEKSLTEQQANAVQYSTRMRQAEANLQALEQTGYDPSGAINYGAMWLSRKKLGGLVSEEAQRYEAAKRNWMSAALRKESGAVISESEYRGADHQYFPQPGDTAATLAQKAQLRATALETMQNAGLFGLPPAQQAEIQQMYRAPIGPTEGELKAVAEVVSDSQFAEVLAQKRAKEAAAAAKTQKKPDLSKEIQLGTPTGAPAGPQPAAVPQQTGIPILTSPAEAATLAPTVRVFQTPDGKVLRNPNYRP